MRLVQKRLIHSDTGMLRAAHVAEATLCVIGDIGEEVVVSARVRVVTGIV